MSPAYRRLSTALTVAAALVVTPLAAAPAIAAEGDVKIQIVGINDFHGRLEPLSAGKGGAALLAGAVDQLRADNPNTLFVSAGDNIGASPFVSMVQDDAPTIKALNEMGLLVSALGNHELDRGHAWLADDVTHGINGTGLAKFPVLGANVEGESPELPESFVKDVGGVTVGFVGVVTEQTRSLVSPDGIRGITFTDPVAAANRVAADLKADGADVVVLLAHEGSSATDCAAVATDGAFGEIVTGATADIDAIISGHTHTQYSCLFDYAKGTRPVVQTGQYGEALDRIEFTVRDGEITAVEAEVLPVANPPYSPDASVAALVADAKAQADEVGQEKIGEITADITRAFTNGGEDRGEESVLGNFIADVQLAGTAADRLGGAQIAFMNPGGLRADLKYTSSDAGEGDGVVTYAEAATVQPFANGVVTMTLTGAQIRQVLEEQWQPEGSSRAFLALGLSKGFYYTYDPEAPRGEHIVSVTLNGQKLGDAATYRVTVNSFLAAGGDNFLTLAEGTDRQDNGFNDLNVLVDYFKTNSPITADIEPRRAVASADPGTPGEPTNPGKPPHADAPGKPPHAGGPGKPPHAQDTGKPPHAGKPASAPTPR
jgi:5'-nucleotidase